MEKSLRTTNAIERLHKEFKRRIETQTALSSSEIAAKLFGVTRLRAGHHAQWETLAERPTELINLAKIH